DGVVKRGARARAGRSQPSYASGTPHRGNILVKISVRAEWRPLFTASTNGELAETASSSGRKLRRPLQTAIARSGPLIATWTCSPNVLLRQTTYRRISSFRR